MLLSFTLPYSLYRVWITHPWHRSSQPVTVSLAKNSQLKSGWENAVKVREGKRQMAEDTGKAMALIGWPAMRPPLVMDATITTRTATSKDDDGAWLGLYPCRDAIAAGLGINDSDIVTGRITWAKGEPESMLIELREANEGQGVLR